jgi:hypothetical protein
MRQNERSGIPTRCSIKRMDLGRKQRFADR